ncbi:hypothetical protein EUGRSUZ_H03493 [Eucalyptus grandis]|uniref:Uncharacterized protein n=2 Tax=Eucalyptus grandis TaxID=71139 RepID=A0ACC3JTZ0_EUCGR|nr:hypothetical protein EUGRSUZ_H03493 [Eucalyptus grandis]
MNHLINDTLRSPSCSDRSAIYTRQYKSVFRHPMTLFFLVKIKVEFHLVLIAFHPLSSRSRNFDQKKKSRSRNLAQKYQS